MLRSGTEECLEQLGAVCWGARIVVDSAVRICEDFDVGVGFEVDSLFYIDVGLVPESVKRPKSTKSVWCW